MFEGYSGIVVHMNKRMQLSLDRNVIIWCEDQSGNTWSQLGKIRHINANLFKIKGDNEWFDKSNIIKPVEEFEDGVCSNCGKSIQKGHMCDDNKCYNEIEWKVKKILKITTNYVKVQWDLDNTTSVLPREQVEEDIPDMMKDFLNSVSF
jgi:hypothetical protein